MANGLAGCPFPGLGRVCSIGPAPTSGGFAAALPPATPHPTPRDMALALNWAGTPEYNPLLTLEPLPQGGLGREGPPHTPHTDQENVLIVKLT